VSEKQDIFTSDVLYAGTVLTKQAKDVAALLMEWLVA
jgi:hypothetical protein